MKVYILDKKGCNVIDKNHNRRYVHMQPCQGCQKYHWDEEECAEIKKAIKLICLLSHFNEFMCNEMTNTVHDWPPEFIGLSELAEPPQPFEYDSDEIRSLQGVLQVSAFIGASDTQLKPLETAYNKIQNFICHVHNDHRDTRGRPIDPLEYFKTKYPTWVDPNSLMYLLQGIRSKSYVEIKAYCQREWDQARKLGFEQRLSGLLEQSPSI